MTTPQLNLLVVDADPALREACRDVAARSGFATRLVDSANALRDTLATADVHLLLMDVRLPGGGLDLLREVRERRPDCIVLIASPNVSVTFAIEAMRHGASDFIPKPYHYEELRLALHRAADKWRRTYEGRRLRERMQNVRGYLDMVGDSPAMERLFTLIQRAALSNSPVLICGEAGSGKELAARTLHRAAKRDLSTFFLFDCTHHLDLNTALSDAAAGTLYLDEIAELSLEVQAQLMRVLQEKQHTCRIIASTQRDLDRLANEGRFRRDLYFALNVIKINVPPLRERRQDIPLLARHFFERWHRTHEVTLDITDDLLVKLAQYDWPGNVRELETCIERACNSAIGAVVSQSDLLTRVASQLRPSDPPRRDADELGIVPLAALEKTAILDALQKLGGDRHEVARRLGVGKTTLYRKIKEYELEGERIH